MILICVKLERAVVCLKYIANAVPLIFLTKTLIWDKMVLFYNSYIKRKSLGLLIITQKPEQEIKIQHL